jgi:hypothetical protein
MRSIKAVLVGLLASATLLLAGCGGGTVDVVIDVPPFTIGYVAQPDFDVIMDVNGQPLAGFAAFPGEEKTVYLPVGSSFLLDSSGPVAWTMVVGPTTIMASSNTGNTVLYAGVAIQQTRATSYQFAANTSATAPLLGQVPVVIYATSLYDSYQVAKINVVLQ